MTAVNIECYSLYYGCHIMNKKPIVKINNNLTAFTADQVL